MNVHELVKHETDLILRLPQKHKIKDTEIIISTLTVEQVIKINPYLLQINTDDLAEMEKMIVESNFKEVPKIVEKYIEPIRNVIESVCGSDFSEIATMEDYFILFWLIYSRMGNLSFLKSIILGAKMSPTKRTEIIAVQKFLTQLS